MRSEELWSSADEASSLRLRGAVGAGCLARALLSIEGAPAEAIERCEGDLSAWAERVAAVARGDSPRAQAHALRRVLARELGFVGDVQDYGRPCNAMLSKVMRRRRGLPVLLSAVWMEVGRRAGFEVDGLSMPGHFIARVGGQGGALVDPFSRGCAMTVKQCAALVRHLSNDLLSWDDHYLEAVDLEAMVERVLGNLAASLRRHSAPLAMYRCLRLRADLRPEEPEPQLLVARMAERLGAPRHAMALYGRVLATRPGSLEARVAERRMPIVRAACGRLH